MDDSAGKFTIATHLKIQTLKIIHLLKFIEDYQKIFKPLKQESDNNWINVE